MASPARIAAEAAEAVRATMLARGIDDRPEWGEWKQGDMCGITDVSGVFKFWSVRVDEFGNPQHVTVIGGPVWGQAQTKEFRTFDPDRLTTKISKQTKRATADTEDK